VCGDKESICELGLSVQLRFDPRAATPAPAIENHVPPEKQFPLNFRLM
jgi:hypothetical protein